jgi:hypothetical protein
MDHLLSSVNAILKNAVGRVKKYFTILTKNSPDWGEARLGLRSHRRGTAFPGPSRMLKNAPAGCHSERSEESRSENKDNARFLGAFGSSE